MTYIFSDEAPVLQNSGIAVRKNPAIEVSINEVAAEFVKHLLIVQQVDDARHNLNGVELTCLHGVPQLLAHVDQGRLATVAHWFGQHIHGQALVEHRWLGFLDGSQLAVITHEHHFALEHGFTDVLQQGGVHHGSLIDEQDDALVYLPVVGLG